MNLAITTIPKLTSIDAEVKGSIFLTSQLSGNDSKRLQLNLGTAHLKFKDACNPSLNFNPSMNGKLYLAFSMDKKKTRFKDLFF